jgi:hypothetical protein
MTSGIGSREVYVRGTGLRSVHVAFAAIETVQDVLIVCPQDRDLRAVLAAGLDERYAIRVAGSDLDVDDDLDAEVLLSEGREIPADGVIGTKDRSALLAALLAERVGVPGPRAEAVLACQHKPTSRAIQRQVCPDAVPSFQLLDGGLPSFGPPWFVKPVVGRLSQEARRVDDPAALFAVRETGRYRDGYARVARLAGLRPEAVRGFLVEELVVGAEVTLEGYVHRGRVTTIGVTDSVMYPGTKSFERFEYPSALPPDRLDELTRLAEQLVPAHGFDDGFFNVEFVVPPDGPAKVLEVNARIASQFAPLVHAVHGRSTYDALFALHCGDDPGWKPEPAGGVAISYVVRVFDDALVTSVPAPDAGIEALVSPGARLSQQGVNDAASYRLAIFSEWGETRAEALERCRARAASLDFGLEPPSV